LSASTIAACALSTVCGGDHKNHYTAGRVWFLPEEIKATVNFSAGRLAEFGLAGAGLRPGAPANNGVC